MKLFVSVCLSDLPSFLRLFFHHHIFFFRPLSFFDDVFCVPVEGGGRGACGGGEAPRIAPFATLFIHDGNCSFRMISIADDPWPMKERMILSVGRPSSSSSTDGGISVADGRTQTPAIVILIRPRPCSRALGFV